MDFMQLMSCLEVLVRSCVCLVQDQTGHEPRKRMRRLFETLYACLIRGGRAVLQIYPENSQQVRLYSLA